MVRSSKSVPPPFQSSFSIAATPWQAVEALPHLSSKAGRACAAIGCKPQHVGEKRDEGTLVVLPGLLLRNANARLVASDGLPCDTALRRVPAPHLEQSLGFRETARLSLLLRSWNDHITAWWEAQDTRAVEYGIPTYAVDLEFHPIVIITEVHDSPLRS